MVFIFPLFKFHIKFQRIEIIKKIIINNQNNYLIFIHLLGLNYFIFGILDKLSMLLKIKTKKKVLNLFKFFSNGYKNGATYQIFLLNQSNKP